MIKFTDWEERTLPQRTKEAILKHVEYAKKRKINIIQMD